MIKKFTDIKKPIRKIYEQDQSMEVVKANLPSEEESVETPAVEDSCNPSKLFSKLFESREMAHIYHLQVNGQEGSYAKHMALGTYYEDVLGLVDEIIEVYQGQHGIVEGYDIIDTKETRTKDPIAYFEGMAEFIKNARKCISSEDTHLHNIIDEVVALIYKTLYKLKFNK